MFSFPQVPITRLKVLHHIGTGTIHHYWHPPRRQPVTYTIHCIPRSSPTPSTTNVTTTPLDIAYADDVDFVSHSLVFLNQVESIAPTCLRHWFLFVNESKTERTSMTPETDLVAEVWRVAKKLRSLLGDAEDVACRKQLALLAFRQMWTLWLGRQHVGEALHL